MRTQSKRVGTWLGALLAGGTAIAGCWPFDFASDPVLIGEVCEDGSLSCFGSTTTTTTGSTTTIDPGCIPADNDDAVADTCGVFVSSSQGKDTNSGTAKDQAFETIQKALDEAKGRPIYLCGETFGKSVEVTEGVQIYGGLDCTVGWTYAAEKRSRIEGEADVVALRVAPGVSVELADVDVIAADANVAGGSSIAVLAESDAKVVLSRCEVTAGLGMEGAAGMAFPSDAPTGSMGNPGADACTADDVNGGANVQNACDEGDPNDDSIGGSGGDSNEFAGSNGSDGLPLAATNGGLGQPSDAGTCTPGTGGTDGATGTPGIGAEGPGTLGASGYSGPAGTLGEKGKPGQGGGGGGAAKGGFTASQCQAAALAGGASGGSGGSGGCGGAGGASGQAGGASIGIVSLEASFSFVDVKIATKSGGNGGAGGLGQGGGAGGAGAPGGTNDGIAALKNGCSGGTGGKGGPGGRGGGGLGGPSIGIAHTGEAPVIDVAAITIGSAGEGGEGDGEMGSGAMGDAAPVMDFTGG